MVWLINDGNINANLKIKCLKLAQSNDYLHYKKLLYVSQIITTPISITLNTCYESSHLFSLYLHVLSEIEMLHNMNSGPKDEVLGNKSTEDI